MRWCIALSLAVVLVSACGTFQKPPTQQEMEALLLGYPGAREVQRSQRFEGAFITRYELASNDPKLTILEHYRRLLVSKGFSKSKSYTSISADLNYARLGCPTYGAAIAVDEQRQQVIIDFEHTPCM